MTKSSRRIDWFWILARVLKSAISKENELREGSDVETETNSAYTRRDLRTLLSELAADDSSLPKSFSRKGFDRAFSKFVAMGVISGKDNRGKPLLPSYGKRGPPAQTFRIDVGRLSSKAVWVPIHERFLRRQISRQIRKGQLRKYDGLDQWCTFQLGPELEIRSRVQRLRQKKLEYHMRQAAMLASALYANTIIVTGPGLLPRGITIS